MPSASPASSGTPEGATPKSGATAHNVVAGGNANHAPDVHSAMPTPTCTKAGIAMPASVPKRRVSASAAGTIHELAIVSRAAAASPSAKLGPSAPSAVSTVEHASTTRFAPSASASA